ncbi:Ppx/GppA phosphatase family protein [Neorhizobium sp. JUb45]|uniref:Ppx/GppA phosphatase family protein n=1 Tax=unclassified Neorhizobium TaxID=2629175 RepID=UPI00104E0CDE|nr:Ppx/GppA phosphatase family protein [Neorhizobium sp. JUb45]TCR04080.1 exopolyphosphatase/guanosine-5'-triphosphate,3'-diphosphate pyrophosphatase [Neorhizobium sp. JUb45]
MDPDSGNAPPDGGASTAGRSGKNRRRRKAKQNGKPRSAALPARGGETGVTGEARRPETNDDGMPVRKRKRRRSRGGAPSQKAHGDNSPRNDHGDASSRGQHHGGDHAAHGAGQGGASHAGTSHVGENHGAAANGAAGGQNSRQNSNQNPGQAPGKGRNRRRNKNRNGRSPQVRPLAPAGQQADKQQRDNRSGKGDSRETVAALPDMAREAKLRHGQHPAFEPRGARHDRGQDKGHDRGPERGYDRGRENLSQPDDLYAALDLGTNNCRLLIAQPTRPGHFRVVDAFSRIVRLGEGLGATGRLSQDAMDRAVDALRVCASKLANRPIKRMRLIATEACRAAENGELFLSRVIAETGLDLEIIDRETEARLAVSGCSSLVGREARSVVLFDIGGGSSEIAVIRIGDQRSSRLASHITDWTSLPVGVVTLSERHGGRDVTPDVFSAMVTEVEGMLQKFQCPPIDMDYVGAGPEDFYLIGTSGTVTTLAGVHLDLPRYDRRRVDGVWLSNSEVDAMQHKLLSWDFAGRAANPCIGPDRADLVLAGCAILEAIRRRWPSTRMRVADRGLREGILTEMMADDGVWRRHRVRRDGGRDGDAQQRPPRPPASGPQSSGARR